MKRKIYFIRHAEAMSNTQETHEGEDTLTKIGLNQAEKVALCFKDLSIENIYTSTILRSKQTAQKIGEILRIEIKNKEFLKERTGSFLNHVEYSPIEKFDDFKNRLVETKNFLEKTDYQKIIVVSHATFIKSFLAYITYDDLITEEMLCKNTNSFILYNTGISKFLFDTEKREWSLESWNDINHLFTPKTT